MLANNAQNLTRRLTESIRESRSGGWIAGMDCCAAGWGTLASRNPAWACRDEPTPLRHYAANAGTTPQSILHCPSRCVPKPRYHVAVDVQRDRDARVPEHLGDDLRVHALGQQQGGAGVPEVVEAYVGQPGTPQERLEAGTEGWYWRDLRRAKPTGRRPGWRRSTGRSGRYPFTTSSTCSPSPS
jgi:hypothetical protein